MSVVPFVVAFLVLAALLLTAAYLLDRLAFHACINTPNSNMLVQMATLVNLLIGEERLRSNRTNPMQ